MANQILLLFIIFRCLIGLCLWCLFGTPEVVAQDASQVSIGGVAGFTLAATGTEVQLYFIELTEIAGGQDAALKTAAVGTREIRFSITDLIVPTGMVAADIASLRLYRSTDAVFDGKGEIRFRKRNP